VRILSPREAGGLLARSFKAWKEDGAPSMGAALAFYTLFSLAPLLLVALAVAGIFFDRSQAQHLLIDQLESYRQAHAAELSLATPRRPPPPARWWKLGRVFTRRGRSGPGA
jgi:uncharacterized BrkB/YihY/UPF0761 family membrane protein